MRGLRGWRFGGWRTKGRTSCHWPVWLGRVRRHPTVLSRERYVGLRGEDDSVGADRSFDALAGEGAKGKPRERPPLAAVHEAVDVVADLFAKYHSLIHAGGAIPSGVIMEPWPYVFRVPWIADDDQFRDVLTKLDESERRRGERPRSP